MNTFGSVVALLFTLVVVVGCASTEVTERQSYEGEKLPRPDRIIVHDFTANPADVPPESAFAAEKAVHSKPLTPEQLKVTQKMGAEVATELVAKLRDAGLPAVQAAGQPAPRVDDIVIRGYFVSVDKGSAAKRVLVGFGSGNAELMTAVEGYQMTSQGLRLLGSGEVKSGGGKMPGLVLPLAVMAATANPIGLVVGGAIKVAGEADGSDTIEGGAKRTADEIATQLETAAKKQGWTQVAAADPVPGKSAPDPRVTTAEPVQSTSEGTSQAVVVPVASEDAFALQLASFKNPESVQQEWTAIQDKFPKLLNETKAIVQPASVEGVGTVYRLKAGSFPTHATAADVCAQLMAAQQDCLVVKR
jgi:cell division septation protein DedD